MIEGNTENAAIRLIEDDFDRNVSQRPILIDVVAVDKVKQLPITGLKTPKVNKKTERQRRKRNRNSTSDLGDLHGKTIADLLA